MRLKESVAQMKIKDCEPNILEGPPGTAPRCTKATAPARSDAFESSMSASGGTAATVRSFPRGSGTALGDHSGTAAVRLLVAVNGEWISTALRSMPETAPAPEAESDGGASHGQAELRAQAELSPAVTEPRPPNAATYDDLDNVSALLSFEES
eukprot:SAG11_NODE_630_length_8069_cov_2.158344_2_plen_153_part_00